MLNRNFHRYAFYDASSFAIGNWRGKGAGANGFYCKPLARKRAVAKQHAECDIEPHEICCYAGNIEDVARGKRFQVDSCKIQRAAIGRLSVRGHDRQAVGTADYRSDWINKAFGGSQ